jgi:pyruvate kinase
MQKNTQKIKRKMSKRTKIIATLGPSTDSLARIKSLLIRGVDVIRVNFSHGDHATHKQTIANVRQVAKENNYHTAILGDLCGPKIRTGTFKNEGIEIKNGEQVIVTTRQVLGETGLIPSQYKNLHKDMQAGQRILLDDGKMELVVHEIHAKELHCTVTYGGWLTHKKGMNLPDTTVTTPSLTAKDKEDLKLAIECDVDFVALSFVRDGNDIKNLKKEMKRYKVDIPIIAKIERPEAIDNIDGILKESYGIMIARGDLGIELAAEKVPLLQNMLIDKARSVHKPVIVATQMMESMIENSRPTRAEIGDVANAAMRSADAVMLSGETSVGKYPLQAVEYMDKTVREIEGDSLSQLHFADFPASYIQNQSLSLRESMAHATMGLARDLNLQALVVPTKTGITAQTLAAYRPASTVLGVSHSEKTCRKMSIHWGVVPIHMDPLDFKDWNGLITKIKEEYSLLVKNDKVLIVSGFRTVDEQSEPVLKLLFI